MLTALPSSFLDRLLSATLMEDAEIRLFVLQILISFIDRHGNKHKFQTIRFSVRFFLVIERRCCMRWDSIVDNFATNNVNTHWSPSVFLSRNCMISCSPLWWPSKKSNDCSVYLNQNFIQLFWMYRLNIVIIIKNRNKCKEYLYKKFFFSTNIAQC